MNGDDAVAFGEASAEHEQSHDGSKDEGVCWIAQEADESANDAEDKHFLVDLEEMDEVFELDHADGDYGEDGPHEAEGQVAKVLQQKDGDQDDGDCGEESRDAGSGSRLDVEGSAREGGRAGDSSREPASNIREGNA